MEIEIEIKDERRRRSTHLGVYFISSTAHTGKCRVVVGCAVE